MFSVKFVTAYWMKSCTKKGKSPWGKKILFKEAAEIEKISLYNFIVIFKDFVTVAYVAVFPSILKARPRYYTKLSQPYFKNLSFCTQFNDL